MLLYQDEIWLPCVGYDGLFASDFGRIKCLIFGREMLLNQHHTNMGYLKVIIPPELGGEIIFAHRLVALAFHENIDNKPCVNHKNCITTDNRPFNLEWCTHQENIRHSVSLGRFGKMMSKEIEINSDLKNEICEKFRAIRVKNRLTQGRFAELLGIKRSLVGAYEEKRAEPKPKTILALCELFDLSIDEFYTGLNSVQPD